MHVDSLGWLERTALTEPMIERYETDRVCGMDAGAPIGACWQWTGGKGGTHGWARERSKAHRTYRKGVDAATSCHLLIAKDGGIFQSASFAVGTWHVGRRARIAGVERHVNRCLIGIEIENAGRIRMFAGRAYIAPFYVNPDAEPAQRHPDPGLEVERGRAVVAKGGTFDAFTVEQEQSAVEVVRALVARYGFDARALSFGPRDFDPQRREDPGALWTDVVLPSVLDRAFASP